MEQEKLREVLMKVEEFFNLLNLLINSIVKTLSNQKNYSTFIITPVISSYGG